MKQKVSKKAIVLMTMFCAVVLAIVSCFISVTHTFFGDVQSGSGNIVIATLDFNSTCPIDLGILEPNTTYNSDENNDYKTTIINSGDSRHIFVKVKFESTLNEKLEPIYDTSKWAKGGKDNNEYYYLGALNSKSSNTSAESVVFNTGFRTLNTFTNADAGKRVTVKLTVYALQAQYYAFKDVSNGWYTYAPRAFIVYYQGEDGKGGVQDTFK